MSIGFQFEAQPNGGSLSYDQFVALHKLINDSGGSNWTVRDPNNGTGEIEVSSWEGHHWVIDSLGVVESVRRWSNDKAPAELVAGVNWWLQNEKHTEDVVALTDDGQDALILSGFNSPDKVVWVNPSGHIQAMRGHWFSVHQVGGEE